MTSIAEVVSTLRSVPPGTRMDAGAVAEWLAPLIDADPRPALSPVAETWRTKLWVCPADTRLGVREVAEAVDRSADWIYRAVNAKHAAERGRDPLPCNRLDGELVFRAADVRAWLGSSEQVVNPAPQPARRQHMKAGT